MIRAMKLTGLTLAACAFVLSLAHGAEEEGAVPHYPLKHPRHVDWTFSGPFGTFDPQQLQRGFQVYREVCASCHSLDLVAFRTLASEEGPHFSEAEVKALAAEYDITDGPDDDGEMFDRPGIPADRIPAPFANKNAAAASNNGAYPPDLSLVAKSRAVERGFPMFIIDAFTQYQESGPDYIYSLLTGYEDPPAGKELQDGMSYNPYFLAGDQIAMASPLSDDQIDYAQNQDDDPANDVPQTVEQYASDVVSFLMWAAEPHLVARKAMGFNVMIFLIIFAGLLYYSKKKVWSGTKH